MIVTQDAYATRAVACIFNVLIVLMLWAKEVHTFNAFMYFNYAVAIVVCIMCCTRPACAQFVVARLLALAVTNSVLLPLSMILCVLMLRIPFHTWCHGFFKVGKWCAMLIPTLLFWIVCTACMILQVALCALLRPSAPKCAPVVHVATAVAVANAAVVDVAAAVSDANGPATSEVDNNIEEMQAVLKWNQTAGASGDTPYMTPRCIALLFVFVWVRQSTIGAYCIGCIIVSLLHGVQLRNSDRVIGSVMCIAICYCQKPENVWGSAHDVCFMLATTTPVAMAVKRVLQMFVDLHVFEHI